MSEKNPNDAAAEESAAAAPSVPPADGGTPVSAEEAQAAATDALDEITMPTPAVAGDEVESAEEALTEALAEPDYKDLYLRGAADMDNLRKRARRDVGAAEARGIGKLAKELLPAIDNLERALQAADAAGESSEDLTQGLRLVQAELAGALSRAGIAIEDPHGQAFDPHRHEALAQSPVEGTEAGIVIEVYQPGYVLGESVLRAARVVVSG